LETLKEFKTRRRFLRSTIQYWIKNNYAKAFQHWAQTTLADKERELSSFLAEKEHERKEL
jgi:cellulose synthase/poly-beta-1,6-N-acetylglucosamine synthase-like glycosyltransferase